MPDYSDNFYTFSAAELAEIKNAYQLLLADKHVHNAQFQNRDLCFRVYQPRILISMLICLLFASALAWLNYMAGSPTFSLPAAIILAIVIFSLPVVLLFMRKRRMDQHLLRLFPTAPIRYDHTPYLKAFHIRQMVKLPDYLIVWPVAKEKQIIPTPDQVPCWIIRRKDQPGAYNKLSATYYHNLLKNPKASRWAEYWLIDGTKKEN